MQLITLPPAFPLTPDETRTGVHLMSHIVTPMFNELFDEHYGSDITEEVRRTMEMGFMWEDVIRARRQDIGHKADPITVDGITMSPDNYDPDTHIVHEIKATYRSTKTTPDAIWTWVTQLKSYCWGMQSQIGQWHVLYICGDYGRPMHPVMLDVEVRFSQKELTDNWKSVVNFAKSKGLI
jgi:hypothetical protein